MMIKHVKPEEIEKRSMEIIEAELGKTHFEGVELDILKRVIHTSADFEYAENLKFSPNCTEIAINSIKEGVTIVTDTNMAFSGINKPALKKLGCEAKCFIADENIAELAKKNGTTRATASMTKASTIDGNLIFAIGNAPTALVEIERLVKSGSLTPALIIAVPVGFVNVVESKNLIMDLGVPYIVAQGRKGGSNVAAAICNALLYSAGGR